MGLNELPIGFEVLRKAVKFNKIQYYTLDRTKLTGAEQLALLDKLRSYEPLRLIVLWGKRSLAVGFTKEGEKEFLKWR